MWFKTGRAAEASQWKENLVFTLYFLGAWVLGGIALLGVCAFAAYSKEPTRNGLNNGLTMVCHGGFLSLAFASVGGLVGFLFGIPRQNRQSDKADKGLKADQPSDSEHDAESVDSNTNTNLEQVADWLTKIILGAGLTQLIRVPTKLRDLGEYFRSGFDNSALLPILIAMNSLVFGFFAGYLLTQLFLAKALKDAADSVRTVKAVLTTAGSLEKMGKFNAATATLEGALATLRPGATADTKRTIYERLTYSALYEDQPTGFQKAIQYGEQYLREEPTDPSARVLANLAAAFGQKYRWDKEHDAPQDSLNETRRRALDSAKKAIESQPQMKALLRMLWNPNDPTKVGNEEDDLEVFYDDPDFKQLFG